MDLERSTSTDEARSFRYGEPTFFALTFAGLGRRSFVRMTFCGNLSSAELSSPEILRVAKPT
jgi:hypothetical protein